MVRTAAAALAAEAHSANIPARGAILGAFEPSCHMDAAAAAAAFADVGCQTIVLHEGRPASDQVPAPGEVDDDDVRTCAEEVCGMDVEGELMSERVVIAVQRPIPSSLVFVRNAVLRGVNQHTVG